MSPGSKPVFFGRTITAAIVGADGSGKTSVAREVLKNQDIPIKYVYLGPAIGSSSHSLPTSRLKAYFRRRALRKVSNRAGDMPPKELMTASERKALERGPILKFLGLINRIGEEWYRQLVVRIYRLRGYSVLCDRHFIYEYCPAVKSSRSSNERLADKIHYWQLQFLYPEPDVVIFLDADAAVLHNRKPEWTLEYLERQRNRIPLQGKHARNFFTVDASQSFNAVVTEVTDIICSLVSRAHAGHVK